MVEGVMLRVVSSLGIIKGWMGVIGMGVFRCCVKRPEGDSRRWETERDKRSVFCAAKFRI